MNNNEKLNIEDMLTIFKEFTTIVIEDNILEDDKKEEEYNTMNKFMDNLRNKMINMKKSMDNFKTPKIIKTNSINIKKDSIKKIFSFPKKEEISLKIQNYRDLKNNLKQILMSNSINDLKKIITVDNLIIDNYNYDNLLEIFENIIFLNLIFIFMFEINNFLSLIDYIKNKFKNNIEFNDLIKLIENKKFFNFIKSVLNNEISFNELNKNEFKNILIKLGKFLIKDFSNYYIQNKYNDIKVFFDNKYLNSKLYNNIDNLMILIRQLIESIYLNLNINNNVFYINEKNENDLMIKNTVIYKHRQISKSNFLWFLFKQESFSIIFPLNNNLYDLIQNSDFDQNNNMKENKEVINKSDLFSNLSNLIKNFNVKIEKNDKSIYKNLKENYEEIIKNQENNLISDNLISKKNYYNFYSKRNENISNKEYYYPKSINNIKYNLNNNYDLNNNKPYNYGTNWKLEFNNQKYNYNNYSNKYFYNK